MSAKKSVMLRNLTKGSRATRNERAELLEGTLNRGYVSVNNDLEDKLATARRNLYDLENITVDYTGDAKIWARNHLAAKLEIAKLVKEIEIAEEAYEELFG